MVFSFPTFFIRLVSKYLLRAHFVPGTMTVNGIIMMNQTQPSPQSYPPTWEMVNKQWFHLIWHALWRGSKDKAISGKQRRGTSPSVLDLYKAPFWWGWNLKDEGKIYKTVERSTHKEVEENICGIRTSDLIWLEIFKCQPLTIVLLDSY